MSRRRLAVESKLSTGVLFVNKKLIVLEPEKATYLA